MGAIASRSFVASGSKVSDSATNVAAMSFVCDRVLVEQDALQAIQLVVHQGAGKIGDLWHTSRQARQVLKGKTTEGYRGVVAGRGNYGRASPRGSDERQ